MLLSHANQVIATIFSRPQDDIGAGIGPMAVATVDLDGDGVLDVVVANGHSNDVSVLRGER